MKQKNVIFLTAMIILSSLMVFAGSELTDNRWLLDNETTVTDYYLNISDGNTPKFIIDSKGQVGIGTPTPDIDGGGSRVTATILGPSNGFGILELASPTSSPDQLNGNIEFANSGQAAGYKIPAYIGAWLDSSGTATKYGASLRFFTQSDNTAGASERVRIDSAGKVGIGITDPSSLLETGSAAGTNEVNLSGVMYVNSTSGNVGINNSDARATLDVAGFGRFQSSSIIPTGDVDAIEVFYYPTGSGYGSILSYNRGTGIYKPLRLSGANITLESGTLEVVSIVDGNMGVNTTTPDTLTALHVESGDVRFNGSGDAVGFYFNQTSGNVGIGTTGPLTNLHIKGASPGQYLEDNGGAKLLLNAVASGYGIVGMESNHPLTFKANNVEWMRITTTGNVGIGTVNPSAKLHVESGDVRFNGTGGADGFYYNQTSNSVNIGGGTVADYPLYVTGQQRTTGNIYTDAGFLFVGADSASSPGFTWNNDPNTGMYNIAPSGIGLSVDTINMVTITNTSVGIGTTDPSSLLETGSVAGTNEVNLSGVLYVNSTTGGISIGNSSVGSRTKLHIEGNNYNSIIIGSNIPGLMLADEEPNQDTWGIYNDNALYISSHSYANRYTSEGGTTRLSISPTGTVTVNQNLVVSGTGDTTIAGNVGIGTTVPGAKLSIVPTGTTGNSNEAIRFNRVEDGLRYNSIYTTIPAGADIGTMSFLIHDAVTTTSQVEILTLKGSGNVGIGTTTPSAKLHVESGDVQFNGTGNAIGFYFNQTTGNIGFGMTDPNSPLVGETQILKIGGSAVPALGFQSSSSSHEAAITIDGNGMYLESGGHATGAGNNFIKFRTADGNNDFTADDRMMIDNKGNVGINTTSATQLLDVHGDVNISSETNPRLNFAGGGYIYDNGTAVIIGHE